MELVLVLICFCDKFRKQIFADGFLSSHNLGYLLFTMKQTENTTITTLVLQYDEIKKERNLID